VSQTQYDNHIGNWNKDIDIAYSLSCNVIANTYDIVIENKLFPNPAIGFISFSKGLETITTIEGKLVFEAHNQTITSANNWSKGVYLAKFKNREVIKFIVK
jgi:hypothetical protein